MNALVKVSEISAETLEAVLVKGDLSGLSVEDRCAYYAKLCESLGLNPLSRPFEYLKLGGRLILYATRNCSDQLRRIHGVSVEELTAIERDGCYVVTAKVRARDGRTDTATGAVSIQGLKGDALCNALMKAETKSKRRATLSICGLSMMDETELETVPEARRFVETNRESRDTGQPEIAPAESLAAFARLREQINLAPEASELQAWGYDNRELIRSFPEAWREQLRSLYCEKMHELRLEVAA